MCSTQYDELPPEQAVSSHTQTGITTACPDRIPVVATSNLGRDEVARAVGPQIDPDAEVKVVVPASAPASALSGIDWLTSAEDDARAEAAARADEVAKAIPTEQVEARVGDVDPLQALDDAVRLFAPDAVVVVTRADDEASWLASGAGDSARARFDVPVTHVVVR